MSVDDEAADGRRERENGRARRADDRQQREREQQRGALLRLETGEAPPDGPVQHADDDGEHCPYGCESGPRQHERHRYDVHSRSRRRLTRLSRAPRSCGFASPTSSTNPEITGSSSPSAMRSARSSIKSAISRSRVTAALYEYARPIFVRVTSVLRCRRSSVACTVLSVIVLRVSRARTSRASSSPSAQSRFITSSSSAPTSSPLRLRLNPGKRMSRPCG